MNHPTDPIAATLASIVQDRLAASDQQRALNSRRNELSQRLAEIDGASQAARNEATAAQAELSAALAAGADSAQARKRIEAASKLMAHAQGLDIEAHALKSAINAIDAEMLAQSDSQQRLAEREKAVALSRLADMAAPLADEQQCAIDALLIANAKARALSEIARHLGGDGSAFAPARQPDFAMRSIGVGWMERGFVNRPTSFFVDAVNQAIDGAVSQLRAEGFKVA